MITLNKQPDTNKAESADKADREQQRLQTAVHHLQHTHEGGFLALFLHRLDKEKSAEHVEEVYRKLSHRETAVIPCSKEKVMIIHWPEAEYKSINL